MTVEDKMLGFCPLCMQNVEHTRKFSSIFTQLFDRLILGSPRIFRLGPYYCFQCESSTWYLKPVRREAPTFNIETSGIDFSSPKHERRRKERRQKKETSAPEVTVESAGNFLKNKHSLRMQERRSNKYSQKFRDGTVQKVLNGKSSIQDTRQELGISEADLMRWISAMVSRKDQRIEELAALLQSFESLPKNITPILESTFDKKGPIIEGRVAGS